MLKIIEIDGMNIESQSLPAITRTSEGKAMGHIPKWASMIDPDYITFPSSDSEENVTLDRVLGSMLPTRRSQIQVAPEKITDPSGNTLIFTPSESAFLQVAGQTDIDPNEWTVFSVFKMPSFSRIRNFIINTPKSTDTGDVALQISFSSQTGRGYVYQDGGDSPVSANARLQLPDAFVADKLHLLMVTFSVKNGLRAFIDGVLAGENLADKRPLTHGYKAGDWQYYRLFRGSYGMTGVLNLDLGDPENAGYRKSIEDYLMQRYEILPA